MPARVLVRVLGTLALGLVSVALPSCGSTETADEEPAASVVPLSGRYEVSGSTVTPATGEERDISGTLIVAISDDGTTYTSTFDLTTTYPGAEEALPAEVIGKGEGKVEGRTLVGTAETQLVMATVPGVDPGFALMPRMVSTRIASTSTAEVSPDGSVTIEIRNKPAPGEEDYAPTRTALRGSRISRAGIGGE